MGSLSLRAFKQKYEHVCENCRGMIAQKVVFVVWILNFVENYVYMYDDFFMFGFFSLSRLSVAAIWSHCSN